jgi:hypothetical protein
VRRHYNLFFSHSPLGGEDTESESFTGLLFTTPPTDL